MIDTTLDSGFHNVLLMMRHVGQSMLRPAGLEADRRGEPIPPDHPMFVEFNRTGLTFGAVGTGHNSNREGPSRINRSAILAAEEMAFWDQGACMSLPGAGLGGPPIRILGNEEQNQRFMVEPFADIEKPAWGAYATTEAAAGSDVARIRTTARKDGDHYVIDGDKMFITNGARASWVVVFATVDPEAGRAGQRAFVIEKDTPGFTVGRIEKKMGLTASETATLFFQNCRVPAANMLGDGKGKSGFKAAMATFDITRPMVAAMGVGIGRCAWNRAAEVARAAFGRSPSSKLEQRMLDRLALARRRLDAARLLCWRAAWKMDHRQTNTIEASMAKVYAPPAALLATTVAMDVCGLAGVRNDELVEKCFRDVKVFDIFEGTGEVQRIVMARRMFGYPRPN
ncbi:MAG: acyl-CoA dehydrogenase family protein [Myxococcota bacterium]|nr:acyl-CoA dehydrogenase family protein [Myxococcota bacterium]